MASLLDKRVLVVGLGASGRAACRLLLHDGARVTAMDRVDTDELQREAGKLRRRGAEVALGAEAPPPGAFDFAVVTPAAHLDEPVCQALQARGVPLWGELELGYQQARCLTIAVSGTNGKTTTVELIERVLSQAHRKTMAAGSHGLPVCVVAPQTRDLDFLTLEVSTAQLDRTQHFRPSIAVLLNAAPDGSTPAEERVRTLARLFQNQQPFDWAVVQSEVLAQLRGLGLAPEAKLITFTALHRRADLVLEHGLIRSHLPGWEGPLLDLQRTGLRGLHNAENLMAALAVGRILRLPLEGMVRALASVTPAPHRCEPVGTWRGVTYVNDAASRNPDALAQAVQAQPPGQPGEPNVWLIADGRPEAFDYHALGPLLAHRVKGAFLLGERRETLRAAWGLFTACTPVDSLLEAVVEATRHAQPGEVVLFSPACSGLDVFRDHPARGEVFRHAVRQVAGSALEGPGEADPSGRREPSADRGASDRPAAAPQAQPPRAPQPERPDLNSVSDHSPHQTT